MIDPVVEVKPEHLQDVKQEPADDETVSETHIPEILSLDRPSDNSSLWLSATDDCYQLGSTDPVVEVKPEDLQDVKQATADETDNEANITHYAVKVRF